MRNQSTLIVALVAALSVALVSAQLERCHTTILTPAHFLNLTQFSGVWYPLKIATSKAYQIQPLNYTCLSLNISLTDDVYKLETMQNFIALENGTAIGSRQQEGTIRYDDIGGALPPHPAIWNVYTPLGGNLTEHTQAVILAADEGQWAIQYTCASYADELYERIQIWSRSRTLEPLVQETLETVAYGIGFARSNFQTIGQQNCT